MGERTPAPAGCGTRPPEPQGRGGDLPPEARPPADDIPFSILCALAENYLKKPPQAPRKKRRRADAKTRGLVPQSRCRSDAPRPAHSLRGPAVHHSSGRRRGQYAFSLVQQASSPFEQLLQHAIVLYEKLLSVKAIHGGVRPLFHERTAPPPPRGPAWRGAPWPPRPGACRRPSRSSRGQGAPAYRHRP